MGRGRRSPACWFPSKLVLAVSRLEAPASPSPAVGLSSVGGGLTGNSGGSRGRSREVACPGVKLRPPGRVSPAALPERRRDETWSARGGTGERRLSSPPRAGRAADSTFPRSARACCNVDSWK